MRMLHSARNDVATHSCTTRIRDVEGKHITTIEGLSANGLDPLQEACEGPKVKFLRPTLPAGGRERAGPFRNRHGSYPLLFAPRLKASSGAAHRYAAAGLKRMAIDPA